MTTTFDDVPVLEMFTSLGKGVAGAVDDKHCSFCFYRRSVITGNQLTKTKCMISISKVITLKKIEIDLRKKLIQKKYCKTNFCLNVIKLDLSFFHSNNYFCMYKNVNALFFFSPTWHFGRKKVPAPQKLMKIICAWCFFDFSV